MKRVVIVGGGIAGVAAGAHLAPSSNVTLLEAEPNLAYHTTGRSAATFLVNYGGHAARPLAAASLPYLQDQSNPFIDAPLLTPRGVLWIASASQIEHLEAIAGSGMASDAGSNVIPAARALEIVDCLDPDHVAAAIWEPVAFDIDVAGLHQAFVRAIAFHGGEIRTSSPVTGLSSHGSIWEVETPDGSVECDIFVNASGAWGDRVAGMAGIEPLGLTPMRRTAFMVPGDDAYRAWPLVVDAAELFYFRPDGVQLLCSLAEEIPDDPGDPRPRMEDVALAIERINEATTLGIRTVNSEWTGLRTFAPDRNMVIGEEPTAPGFFWLVGQGGMGIATAPAYGALLAAQVDGEPTPEHFDSAGVDPGITDPTRFRSTAA